MLKRKQSKRSSRKPCEKQYRIYVYYMDLFTKKDIDPNRVFNMDPSVIDEVKQDIEKNDGSIKSIRKISSVQSMTS